MRPDLKATMGWNHFNRMKSNELFKEAIFRARLVMDSNNLHERNTHINTLHKIAFETTILFSPNVYTSLKPHQYAEIIHESTDISLTYLENILYLLNKTPNNQIRRKDLLEKSLKIMYKRLREINTQVGEKIQSGEKISRKELLKYNAELKKIRRSYFKVKTKIDLIESNNDLSEYKIHHSIDKIIKKE